MTGAQSNSGRVGLFDFALTAVRIDNQDWVIAMEPLIYAKSLAAACAVCVVAALSCDAGQPSPPFSSAHSVAPDSAPNPPTIEIKRSGAAEIRLDWQHGDVTLTGYEVWRGETPYFSPESDPAVSLGSYGFSDDVYGENTAFRYVDNGACGYFVAADQQLPCSPQSPPVTVVGDAAHQYYWIVRAGNGEYADSNRVGAFDFALVAGA